MYSKPLILQTEEINEGIFADSGCYAVNARIHQRPETGRNDFRIQINARHNADHTKTQQVLHITFTDPVNYQACYMNGATLLSGNGTNSLSIGLGYYQNPTDNIGGGDLVVTSDNYNLGIVSVSITD